jgi:hypothetical protein
VTIRTASCTPGYLITADKAALENFADPRADGRAFLRHSIGRRRTRRGHQGNSRNVQQAAQGTVRVSSNITDVQRGASETGLGILAGPVSGPITLLRGRAAQDGNQQLLNSVRAA